MANIVPSVKVRKKPLKSDEFSLYLDYYPAIRNPRTKKYSRREFLGLRLFSHPVTETEIRHNKKTLLQAEAIRCQRVQDIVNMKFGFIDHEWEHEDFLLYYNNVCRYKNQKWLGTYLHFVNYVNGSCVFGDLNISFCNGFKEYLQNATCKRKGTTLSYNSAAGYWSTFRAALAQAFKEKKMPEDINTSLEYMPEKIPKKEFLTLDEVKKLNDTPCKYDCLKRASIFSCLTGLRISDIIKLRWEELEPYPEGGFCMRICIQKTQTEVTLPISDEAYELCGSPGTGLVFKDFNRSWINHPLKEWLKDAGISKKISFHCFRHTFATLQIAAGTDIYTVSKMLAHANVTTTQRYAQLVNSKKMESANKISLKK